MKKENQDKEQTVEVTSMRHSHEISDFECIIIVLKQRGSLVPFLLEVISLSPACLKLRETS